MVAKVTIKAYASASCVLLTYDWKDGIDHPDFLGFAIKRTPGYTKAGEPQYLFNKLDFVPLAKNAKPKGSDKAPIQKFNWWDGGIDTADRGKTFSYKVIPVLGSGPDDLKLHEVAAGTIKVTVPLPLDGQIATYFNRAVVSAQSFIKQRKGSLEKQMDWLANGLQAAVPDILAESDAFDCAIYHLTDNRWIIPALSGFKGRGSITYFDKGDDTKSRTAAKLINKENPNVSIHKRDAITRLMHDKFIISYRRKHEQSVLMGSTNFTPEAQTIQANLLHIIHSRQLSELYAERANLLAKNVSKSELGTSAKWKDVTDVAGSEIRVFFLPETGKKRDFLDTVTAAVDAAKSSVLFCMFTASDKALMEAIFAKGNSDQHLIYGLLNSIDDPDKPTKKGEKRKLPEIASTIFHRSQSNPDTLPYSAFGANAPQGFLPELRTIDVSSYDASKTKGKKGEGKASGPPPIHVHHKFIVIDGDTDAPTIYTGSPNFSKASENDNDENVLEIKGNTALAQAYVAEFMRLYNHYRARAIWNRMHETTKAKKPSQGEGDPLVLKRSRDEWVKGAFKKGNKAYLARIRGL